MRQRITAVMLAAAILTGAPALAQRPGDDAEQARIRRSNAVSNMERALESAVRAGAMSLYKRLQRGAVEGSARALLLSAPSALGIDLPDYGLVFTVRVPGMDSTMLWAISRILRPQNVPFGEPARPSNVGVPGSADLPPVSPDAETLDVLLKDPDEAYRTAIRDAIIDSMLEDSLPLRLGPNESLTVAAARNEPPQNPLDLSERVRTVTFTVKGSVLEALRLNKIDLPQARKLVVVASN